jgi:hypothetical protein
MCDKADGIYYAHYEVFPSNGSGWGQCALIMEELKEDCDCIIEDITDCEHCHITEYPLETAPFYTYRNMDTHTDNGDVWETIKVFLGKGAYICPMRLIYDSPQHTEPASEPLPSPLSEAP